MGKSRAKVALFHPSAERTKRADFLSGVRSWAGALVDRCPEGFFLVWEIVAIVT
jgi:hypothetical protein